MSPKSTVYRGIKMRRRRRSWQVDYGTRKGKRTQRSFKNRMLAKMDIDAHRARERIDQADLQDNAISLYHLTQPERMDVLEARATLKGIASLQDAAAFYMLHHAAPQGSCTVNEMFDQYKQAKLKTNCREWHLRTIQHRIGRFARDFGSMQLGDITAEHIERWLNDYASRSGEPLGPQTRNNYLAYLNAFFNFAAKKGHAVTNPVAKIDRARLDRREIAILLPDQVRRLLHAATKYAPELVPYFAIGLFAGVRPTELSRLRWEEINFDLKYIHITGEVAKVRNERYVDIEDVLMAWLKTYHRESGPILPVNSYSFNKLFNRVRKDADLKDTWSPDSMRHSYGSYHVAKYEAKNKTALMMGHSVRMLDRHYRRPLHRSDTTEFWSIMPDETP